MSTTLKLSTKRIIEIANALNALGGYQQIVIQQGNRIPVTIPYDLTMRVRWAAAKNLAELRVIAEAHSYIVGQLRKEINAFKRGLDPAADPKENNRKIQDKVDEVNQKVDAASEEVHTVEKVQMMPAEGFNLKTSPIPPEVLTELMPLIEGEPNFEDKPPAK
jgi:hypothetical protein